LRCSLVNFFWPAPLSFILFPASLVIDGVALIIKIGKVGPALNIRHFILT